MRALKRAIAFDHYDGHLDVILFSWLVVTISKLPAWGWKFPNVRRCFRLPPFTTTGRLALSFSVPHLHVFFPLQSANAEKPLPTNGSREEREKQK